jgi:hypothetical protein
MADFLYIMRTPFSDLLKIGHATNVDARARQLSASTGVPGPYVPLFYCRPSDHLSAIEFEQLLHDALKHGRVNPKKEHFNLPAEEIREAISHMLNEEPEYWLAVWGDRIRRRMRQAWNDARHAFWRETAELRNFYCERGKPAAGTISLDPNLPSDEKIDRLLSCVKAHTCHAARHVWTKDGWTHAGLHIFTRSGIGFSCIDLPIANDGYWGTVGHVGTVGHLHHRLPELCDALVRKERELYASVVTSTEG